MDKDEIIYMARELVTRHGIRMCDEDGETHGEELYCVDVDDVVEIIKQSAAHERERTKDLTEDEIWKVIDTVNPSAHIEDLNPFSLCRAVISAYKEKNK